MNKLITEELKWIFVSGKGGVGKTTTSASIASTLSNYKDSVLIISTDPAHSLSDLFNQQFTNSPTLVNSYENLFCLEYDSSMYIEDKTFTLLKNEFKQFTDIQKLFINIPGIEEAMGYIALMNMVSKLENQFSCIIFDTAPTGNTLKLLEYPTLLKDTIQKLVKSNLLELFKSFVSTIYNISSSINSTIDHLQDTIITINKKLINPEYTTFICVMIPEFLSIFESERFLQMLYKFNINCDTIVINQVITEQKDMCTFLQKRKQMQRKYLDIIYDLYEDEDFLLIRLPLLEEEIRYSENIKIFSQQYFSSRIVNENISLEAECELQKCELQMM